MVKAPAIGTVIRRWLRERSHKCSAYKSGTPPKNHGYEKVISFYVGYLEVWSAYESSSCVYYSDPDLFSKLEELLLEKH